MELLMDLSSDSGDPQELKILWAIPEQNIHSLGLEQTQGQRFINGHRSANP
jgi:hypothetical protein